VLIANDDEVMAVLWIHDFHLIEPDNSGVKIFDPALTSYLFAKGASVYPNTHPNFVSVRGDIKLAAIEPNLRKFISSSVSENVPQMLNRLILINSNIPFTLNCVSRMGSKVQNMTGRYFNNIDIAIILHFSGRRKSNQ